MTIQDAKSALRRLLLKSRNSIPSVKQAAFSRRVVTHLIGSSYYKRARVIACFIDFGSEVKTGPLIERIWKDRKKILIPMTSKGIENPYFVPYAKADSLRRTEFGTWELEQGKSPAFLKDIDLFILPGLGFDERGVRLGYGGGFYDRILKKASHAARLGLFFSQQRIFRIPWEKHDQRLHAWVTEKGIGRSSMIK